MTRLPFPAFLLAASLAGFAAQGQQRPGLPAGTDISRRPDGTPELVRFIDPATAPAATDAARVLRTTLSLGAQTELRGSRPAETDALGITHQRYQQFYQGVPVEFSAYNTLARNGKLELLSGELLPVADGAVDVRPTLTASQALPAALRFVHARQYMWQLPNEGRLAQAMAGKATFRPTGQLVIVSDNRTEQPVLAWKFDIYAAQPDSRAWLYVDAHTGAVVNRAAISQEAAATATFTTKYSGTRQLANQSLGSYYLWEYTRGLGIETNNAQRTSSLTSLPGLFDANNVWTAAEYNNANQDWVGGDAHFGAQQTYDYWLTVHGRNSFDGAGAKLKSYYHYDPTPGDGKSWKNARWNGSVMLYGDGGSGLSALTTLDICGHEMGHAICQYTAQLQYFRESGALNEAFSDIWAACIERRSKDLYGLPNKHTWLLGEEIFNYGGFLRSMSDPKASSQPNTYQGVNWVYPSAHTDTIDYGGVHTNSGVLNYWFFLVSQGGTGTNDKGHVYSVAGIGMTKAAKIAYLTEKLLSPTSNYNAARLLAIQAATTLYGANSPEVRTVTNAMYAVGLGSSIPYATVNPGAGLRYIAHVGLNSLSRFSSTDGGYFDGVAAGATAPTLTRCALQTLVHSAGFATGAAPLQYWNVWVDLNHDGGFNNADERIVTNKVVTAAGWVSTTFYLPATALLGLARMRVTLTTYAITYPCGNIGNGEAEDYNLNIAAAAPVGLPTGLSASNITATTATVQWAAVPGAAFYRVKYRMTGTSTWVNVVASGSHSQALTGLTAGQQYQFTVQAGDGCSNFSITSQPVVFSTPAARPTGITAPASATGATASAYPNPATTVLHLRLTATDGAETAPRTAEVVDLRGRLVQQVSYDGSGSLNVSALTPGTYSATLRGANGTPAHVRFVKE